MTYEKLNAIRVWCDDANKDNFYCLIIHDPFRKTENHRDFYIINDTTGEASYMFGLETETDEEAVDIAYANMIDYIDGIVCIDE